MKRLLTLLLCMMLALPAGACSETADTPSLSFDTLLDFVFGTKTSTGTTEPEMVQKAVETLKDFWLNDSKSGYKSEYNMSRRGYLEILHTQLSYISDEANKDESLYYGQFYNIYCVIDFVLLSDYYGTDPYYSCPGMYQTVAVYTDGTMKVLPHSPFSWYSARAYIYDYSGIISEVKNLGDQYNGSFFLLEGD
ncbi:MAG: hypothetical protein IKQ45_05085 [Clostridia bacterium]|nr:hypothetical protein [Clostridia bacterium]